MNDEFDGIFDHLTPEDFNVETTAVETSNHDHPCDEAAFDRFVTAQVSGFKIGYLMAEGGVQPIAVLVSPTIERLFTADDDETLAAWVARLNREATMMGAIWTFIAKKTMVGVVNPADQQEPPSVNDPASVQKAMDAGALTSGVVWYAERREGSERSHRLGTMTEGEGHRLVDPKEATQQKLDLFAAILDR